MKSNFEFLKIYMDTHNIYENAKAAEKHYIDKIYDSEFSQIRKIIENLTNMILDFNFFTIERGTSFNDRLKIVKNNRLVDNNILDLLYELKSYGNNAAHSLTSYSDEEGLSGLKKLREILIWFSIKYVDENLKIPSFFKPSKEVASYVTTERKLIYIQTADNSTGNWPVYEGLEKIGEASTPSDDLEADWTKNSDFLREIAHKRIKSYMKTAGIPYKLEWTELAWIKSQKRFFHDYDVHNVLKRSGVKKDTITAGNEWYRTDVETVKRAIEAVKNGQLAIDGIKEDISEHIVLRPEQVKAVDMTKKAFKKYDKVLWNAKMRFGKTLTALELIKQNKYKKVLIMTHRPVVSDSWFEDFDKMGLEKEGYYKASRKSGESVEFLDKNEKPFIYFASLQDLVGSIVFNGKVSNKNEIIAEINWDLIIVDEAHDGTQTDPAKFVIEGVTKENTKLLELTGTPFNLLDKYDESQVYTWDYVMEQEAKYKWTENHPNERNPYEGLPKVSMYTFEMQSKEDFTDINKSFNFKEFFKVNESGELIYEEKVNQFLDNITTKNSKTHYPFSTPKFRNELRHTLWLLPGIKEAKALKKLMDKHPIFGNEYKVINIVDKDDDINDTSDDLNRVRNAITDKPSKTKTITLTVRKLTTGVNVKEWSAIVFLSNTTSAMQYLQAAFRAQTPFSDEELGMKTNCYIFDFAPDRALTVMAESVKMNSGIGKRVSSEEKKDMAKLLNFLPIIGEKNQGMKEFSVDDLLSKIKRVYAEKAVRSGFDDDSLYSDELLMHLSESDLQAFNDLKAIVGTTKSEKKKLTIDVNNQGLDDEEYEKAIRATNKSKKERNPEEIIALEKYKALSKQRKTMISILRGISIRIPMMIYGMPIDINQDVDIDTFINNVDGQSWNEFMPKGITKGKFREISKYYDADVFLEAGRIIRQKVKLLDTLDPIQRAEELGEIFGTFKNPDKETVLTPWRVVNLHMGTALGGYSFFNEDFSSTTLEGVPAGHWIEGEKIYDGDKTFLEINSKTGLYPLYVAISMYKKASDKLNNEKAGKFSVIDERNIWKNILKKNIFVIAKTPMAKTITERTLFGYNNVDGNIVFIDKLINTMEDKEKLIETFGEKFNKMKFDVIIGNPPYNETLSNDNDNASLSKQLFPRFIQMSTSLDADFVSLITPSRWFTADAQDKSFLKLRNYVKDNNNFKKIVSFPNSKSLFPSVLIPGGVNFFVYEKHYKGPVTFIENYANKKVEVKRPLFEDNLDIIIPMNQLVTILHKVTKNTKFIPMTTITKGRNAFGINGKKIRFRKNY